MPPYQLRYRTSLEDVAAHYETLQAAFDDGNYTHVAACAQGDPELQGCAYVMLGHPGKGLELLSGCADTERSLFHKAVGFWFLGDAVRCFDAADRLLAKNPESPLHQKLSTLLKKERINVLVMSKEFDTSKLLSDRQFNVLTIGRSFSDDVKIDLNTTAAAIMDKLEEMQWRPDFFFVFRPEYLVLFKGLERLPFPKIAFCSDYDLHIYQKYNDFLKFDKLVVYSSIDHLEMKKVFRKPVHTFIFSHTVRPGDLEKNGKEKKYDVLLTGSSFKTFFADKSVLISALTALDPKYNVLINDGFLSPAKYQQWMQQARVIPTFVRFYGCFPTRGIEALAAGASVFYPEKGSLELFFEKDEGIYPYASATVREDATKAIEQSRFSCGDPASGRSFESLTDKHPLDRFLKFCAIVSFLPGGRSEERDLAERSDLSVVGYHTLHATTGANLTQEQISGDFHAIIAYNRKLSRSKHSLNSIAITYVYLRQHVDSSLPYVSAAKKDDMVGKAIAALREGISEFPDALALYFNLGRILFHFGYLHESLQLFEQMLFSRNDLNLDCLQDDIMSGIFFFDEFFVYRHYVDAIMNIQLKGDDGGHPSAESIIYSGAYYYLAKICCKLAMTDAAVAHCNRSLELHPGNFITKHLLVELLHAQYVKSGDASQLPLLIRRHEESAGEYSRYLHPHVLCYADALLALQMHGELKTALNQWFLFFKRVRVNCEVLPLELSFIEGLLAFSSHLPEEAVLVFNNVTEFVNGGRRRGFSEFEDEIIFKLHVTANRHEELAKAIASEGYRPHNKAVYLELALHLTRMLSLPNALRIHLRYLKASDYFGFATRQGLRRDELLDFVVTVVRGWPRLYIVMRHLHYWKTRLEHGLRACKNG